MRATNLFTRALSANGYVGVKKTKLPFPSLSLSLSHTLSHTSALRIALYSALSRASASAGGAGGREVRAGVAIVDAREILRWLAHD